MGDKYKQNILVYDDIDYDSLLKTLFTEFSKKYITLDTEKYFGCRQAPDGFLRMRYEILSKIKEYADSGCHIEHLKIKSFIGFVLYKRGFAIDESEFDIGVIVIPKEDLDRLDAILEDIDEYLNIITDCQNELNFHRIVVKNMDGDICDEYIAHVENKGDAFNVTKIKMKE